MTIILAEGAFGERLKLDFAAAKKHIESGDYEIAFKRLDYTVATLDEIHWELTEWGGPLLINFDSIDWSTVKPPIVFAGHGYENNIGAHPVAEVASKLLDLPAGWKGGVYLLACNIGQTAIHKATQKLKEHNPQVEVEFVGGFNKTTASTSGKRVFLKEREFEFAESIPTLNPDDFHDIAKLVTEIASDNSELNADKIQDFAKKVWTLRKQKGFHSKIEDLATAGFYRETQI